MKLQPRSKIMKVKIKKFNVEMEVKNAGIELEIRDNNDNFLGDCYLTKASLIWCQGRTKKRNGKRVSWEKFIKIMEE